MSHSSSTVWEVSGAGNADLLALRVGESGIGGANNATFAPFPHQHPRARMAVSRRGHVRTAETGRWLHVLTAGGESPGGREDPSAGGGNAGTGGCPAGEGWGRCAATLAGAIRRPGEGARSVRTGEAGGVGGADGRSVACVRPAVGGTGATGGPRGTAYPSAILISRRASRVCQYPPPAVRIGIGSPGVPPGGPCAPSRGA